MTKSKSPSRMERTKSVTEREAVRAEERISDGVVDAELEEMDTDKYEPPGRTYR